MRSSQSGRCGGDQSVCSDTRPGTGSSRKTNMTAMTRASRVAASGDQRALGSILKRRSSMNRRATRSRMSLARNPAAAKVIDHPSLIAMADGLKIDVPKLQKCANKLVQISIKISPKLDFQEFSGFYPNFTHL